MRRKRKQFTADFSDAQMPATDETVKPDESKYSNVAQDSDFQRKAGLDIPPAEDKKPEVTLVIQFKPEDFAFVLDVYAAIISFIFASALKSDFQTIHEVCKFDREQ